ncbi:MAG: hypothetical protein JWL76_9 [Thermoleophilia bacterium]|nr:hypothetical protein [Thermoleophilia bacterium]
MASVLVVAATGVSSQGASSGTVVGASIPATVSIDDSGCSAAATHEFGATLPGSPVKTSACRIDFTSSNESAMLRLSKRGLDPTRAAMAQETWTFASQRAATGVALNDIEAYSRNVAWAVGDNGTILKTTDGGATWPAQASGVADHLRTVQVIDASTVWVVGNGGRVLKTTNGGTTWTPVNAGTAVNLYDVDSHDGTLWISGDTGVVRRTDDAGATWTSVGGAMTGTVEAVEAVTNLVTVAATSSPSEIWRSANRGTSWTRVSTGIACAWHSLDAPSPTVVYVGGCSNVFGVSNDAGGSWNIRTDAWTEGEDIEAVSPTVAYQADSGGGIDRTYDGLGTLPFHPNDVGIFTGMVTGLAVPAVEDVWFVGSDGFIGRSVPAATVSDYAGGANWGSGTATSTFGVCVQSIGGTTTQVWAPDTTGISGTCETNDADTWRAIPNTATKIAQTAVGAAGRVDLVWGMRAATGQSPGRYFAPVTFEALAPAV